MIYHGVSIKYNKVLVIAGEVHVAGASDKTGAFNPIGFYTGKAREEVLRALEPFLAAL